MGIDPSESEERISGWADRNDFFWPLAPVSADPVKDYRISQQSAAVGIDASGEIVLRKNGGLQGEGKWREWLNTLSGKTASAEPEAPSAAASTSGTLPTSAVSDATPVQTEPTAAPAPTTAPVAAPTAVTAPTDAPAPVVAPAPTITPSPIPTATPRPAPTA
ncbi:MAG: hypothetical protein OXC99_11845, partial [Chloroflexi bacterium]|nr:hypothetical protein [Chloroflexota bacterium]